MNGDEKTQRGAPVRSGKPTPAQAILDVADSLIREQGADGWSLTELAELAALPVETVRAEFGSEWEVFAAVIRRDEQGFEAVFKRTQGHPPGERIMRLLEACVPDFDWTYWIELWGLALRDERAAALRVELDKRFRDLVEEVVRDGVASGEFEVPDTRVAAITIATLIDAMATQATLGDTTVRPNYMLDACVIVAGSLLGTGLNLPKLSGADDA